MGPEAGTGAASSARRKGKRAEVSARKKSDPANRWNQSASNPRSRKADGPTFVGGRTIVFMMGGMSYIELRTCRDVMQKNNTEIVCGSTAFVNAEEFMDDLATLVGG